MPACRACHDPRRDQIDQQLISGVPLRTIVSQTGLSLGGLVRHKQHIKEMIGLALKERSPEETLEHAEALANRVEEVICEARDICAKAKAEKSFAAATGALNTIARSLELLGKLTGEIATPNAGGIHFTKITNTTVNVGADDDVSFAVMIGEATKGFDVA